MAIRAMQSEDDARREGHTRRIVELLVEIRDLLRAGEPRPRIVLDLENAVVTSQPAPTQLGPERAQKESTMSDTIGTLKSTDVYAIPLTLTNAADGTSIPVPASDTFTAVSSSPALSAVASNLTGAWVLTVNALTLPSANTMGMTVTINDSAGDVQDTLTVNYPVPVVGDITASVANATVTTQPAPTAPGP